MDNQKSTKKSKKSSLKSDVIKVITAVDGVNELKDIKSSYDKELDHIRYDIGIIVDYSKKIPDVAWNVQTSVIETVENHTERTPDEVNIHIEGVRIKEKNV